jgi:hypothetical protein
MRGQDLFQFFLGRLSSTTIEGIWAITEGLKVSHLILY